MDEVHDRDEPFVGDAVPVDGLQPVWRWRGTHDCGLRPEGHGSRPRRSLVSGRPGIPGGWPGRLAGRHRGYRGTSATVAVRSWARGRRLSRPAPGVRCGATKGLPAALSIRGSLSADSLAARVVFPATRGRHGHHAISGDAAAQPRRRSVSLPGSRLAPRGTGSLQTPLAARWRSLGPPGPPCRTRKPVVGRPGLPEGLWGRLLSHVPS